MTQQTAVEWIIDQLRQLSHSLEAHLGTGDIRVTQGMIDEFEEQAKQMEKEQHRRTWDEGVNEYSTYYHTFEQYYNETYKQ